MTRGRRCVVVRTDDGVARVQVDGKLTHADRDAVVAFARELAARAPATEVTPEQQQHRRNRHVRNLLMGVRGTLSIARTERDCLLCDTPLRRGDEIVTCEGGMLCPTAGAWPCIIHADHREDSDR